MFGCLRGERSHPLGPAGLPKGRVLTGLLRLNHLAQFIDCYAGCRSHRDVQVVSPPLKFPRGDQRPLLDQDAQVARGGRRCRPRDRVYLLALRPPVKPPGPSSNIRSSAFSCLAFNVPRCLSSTWPCPAGTPPGPGCGAGPQAMIPPNQVSHSVTSLDLFAASKPHSSFFGGRGRWATGQGASAAQRPAGVPSPPPPCRRARFHPRMGGCSRSTGGRVLPLSMGAVFFPTH